MSLEAWIFCFKCQQSRNGKSWDEELSLTLLLTTAFFAFSSPDPDVVSTDGTGVSLDVRSDMLEASDQQIPIGVEWEQWCSRGRFCVCEATAESGCDAVDEVQQNRRAGWILRCDGLWSGKELEVDDDVSGKY
jgi:hypothetical protein